MLHFADRLAESVHQCGNPVCLGIDPRWESLPRSIRESHDASSLESIAHAFAVFGLRVLELVGDRVPVIKPQAAFFEACGPDGLRALQAILERCRQMKRVTILDAKRGDIAGTATAYADAAFAGIPVEGHILPVWDADALTVNPYLGRDALEPFLQSARQSQRGVFVLVRTSNPGAGLFQDLRCDGRPLYEHVGQAVANWNHESIGECGYGDVGAVVGATHPRELMELRAQMPEVWFLIPGYGAQGGSADDVRHGLRGDGLGAIVNSSRGLTFPFAPDDPNWESAIRDATTRMIEALRPR